MPRVGVDATGIDGTGGKGLVGSGGGSEKVTALSELLIGFLDRLLTPGTLEPTKTLDTLDIVRDGEATVDAAKMFLVDVGVDVGVRVA